MFSDRRGTQRTSNHDRTTPHSYYFCETFLNYASYDHECWCVRKPWSKRNILDTHNMFIRPTKNFLFASEVRLHHQNRTFSWIFHVKVACLRSNSGVPNSKNEELITFVAIKNHSYIVWSSHLFLRIALKLEKSSSATLMFQTRHKNFFARHKTLRRVRWITTFYIQFLLISYTTF